MKIKIKEIDVNRVKITKDYWIQVNDKLIVVTKWMDHDYETGSIEANWFAWDDNKDGLHNSREDLTEDEKVEFDEFVEEIDLLE